MAADRSDPIYSSSLYLEISRQSPRPERQRTDDYSESSAVFLCFELNSFLFTSVLSPRTSRQTESGFICMFFRCACKGMEAFSNQPSGA
ncbi:hypothetical protein TNCV_1463321 [Trichonephila clavipes]|uniref:Uncharacterized protein n=1 Tax=Trichonephila clavipes TaxID=2585209 RepID=A0A8X6SAJ8_TRICX|nr:hypothetical protein TNCV_1463321 [Trichonephila clavipes]